jgi:hypothetical protein
LRHPAILAAAIALAGGCARTASTSDAPPADARGAALERRIEALRLRLVSDRSDAGLHLALARALAQAGRPGGALRHFEEVRRRRRLKSEDARALAELYAGRAAARVGQGDGEAWRDVERARDLGGSVPRRVAAEAWFAGALAALRHGDPRGRDRAAELLGRAGEEAPGDPRLAAADPARARLEALAGAAAWVADGGARRAALELYAGYIERGGRELVHARRYLALHRWWYGDRERPSALLLDQLAGAGADLCLVARDLDELRCGEALRRDAGARATWRRAARLGWRTSDPDVAAAWVEAALLAWLDREVGSWTDEVARRVDLAAVAAARMPLHAAPTLLRAAGHPTRAAAALDRAVANPAGLSPAERSILAVEMAAAGRSDRAVDQVVAAGATNDLAWRGLLRVAREREPGGAREAALLDRSPREVAAAHLRAVGEIGALAAREPTAANTAALARWRRAVAHPRLRAGREAALERWRRLAGDAPAPPGRVRALPLGAADPFRITSDARHAAALERIARAYLRSPAAAERLAEDFVDGALAIGQRGPLVAELFLRLGDPARGWRWAERVSRSSPDHPAFLMAAGAASVAAGDPVRADVFFVRAAAASGDAGAASLSAARRLMAADHALAAVAAARRAVQLTAPGEPENDEALALAAAGLERLGRAGDARELRRQMHRPLPAPTVDPFPGIDAAAWPGAIADRLALALVAPPAHAAPLFTQLADELDRAGLHQLATACRNEGRSLSTSPF